MITAPLPRASPSGSGRLSMIIPRYYGLTIIHGHQPDTLPCSLARAGNYVVAMCEPIRINSPQIAVAHFFNQQRQYW